MEKKEFIIGKRPQKEWGWLIILALFFTGSGAGSFFFALILGSVTRMLMGVILVLVGALFLLADLSRPLSGWRVILRPQSSWITRGALGIISFFVLSVLYMLAVSLQHGRSVSLSGAPWTTGPTWLMVLGVLSGAVALFVAAYPGFLLGSMRAIPFWNTALLPVLFMISGLLCGLGEIYLMPLQWEGQTWGLVLLNSLSVGLLILGFFLLLSLILTVHSGTTKESVRLLTSGSLRSQFVAGVIGIGVIVPLIILVLIFGGATGTSLLPIAGILLTLGMLLFRYSILKAGIYTTPV
ncbi:MAG: polysulfide reductase NrfD [Deltaproteobacteria bacterium]|nr:MAG: polysulfide reductase NrfD [Deltaproteobacteria bacterium]